MTTHPHTRADKPALIERLAWICALIAGALLTGIALMSVASIIMRAAGLRPIQGDFELVQIGLAACIALLLPWCQLNGGNIIVDFFTAHLRPRHQRRLDAFGAVLFAVVMALVAWRTGVGAVAIARAGETSMILGFPIWIGYALMTPGLALTAVTALHGARRAWNDSRHD